MTSSRPDGAGDRPLPVDRERFAVEARPTEATTTLEARRLSQSAYWNTKLLRSFNARGRDGEATTKTSRAATVSLETDGETTTEPQGYAVNLVKQLAPVLGTMVDGLLKERPVEPKVWMIKYLAAKCSQQERAAFNFAVTEAPRHETHDRLAVRITLQQVYVNALRRVIRRSIFAFTRGPAAA
mmetsp:Transcript_5031/g.11145  ORF Transcript_5031/g.11145 Transcript_5031/m.11145 type:complete len:183 (+) Transcript_5031:53-601(+)